MTDPLEDLRFITITVDTSGVLSLDSDLPAAESVWVLMDAIEYLRHPEESDRASSAL